MSKLKVVERLEMIKKRIEELANKQLVVGAIDGGVRDNGMTNAELLAIHEFGAIIDHPGGTSYGYRTERQAKQGKVRFLGKGQGYMELGKTGAHKIIIPERPVLRTTLANNKQAIGNVLSQSVAECLRGNLSVNDAYDITGKFIRTAVLETFESNNFKPNAKSTIRQKKGSTKPLTDEGWLKGSISYEVRDRE